MRGEAAKVICRINQSSAAVISADINSGLSGDGFSSGLCVASALTVSVGYYKTGHFLGAADEKIGRLKNCEIGIGLCGEGYPLFAGGESAAFSARFGETPRRFLPVRPCTARRTLRGVLARTRSAHPRKRRGNTRGAPAGMLSFAGAFR